MLYGRMAQVPRSLGQERSSKFKGSSILLKTVLMVISLLQVESTPVIKKRTLTQGQTRHKVRAQVDSTVQRVRQQAEVPGEARGQQLSDKEAAAAASSDRQQQAVTGGSKQRQAAAVASSGSRQQQAVKVVKQQIRQTAETKLEPCNFQLLKEQNYIMQ